MRPRQEPSSIGRRLRPLFTLFAPLAVLALLAVGVFAPAASAIVVRVDGRLLGYQPLRTGPGAALSGAAPAARPGSSPKAKANAKALLEYHGGPVMSSNTNYAVYWDPAGAPSYPAGYQTGIDRWFEDLAHDSGGLQNTDSVLAQYGDTAGEHAAYLSYFGGELIDTDPYPADGCAAAAICLTDDQIRAELTHYVEARSLPVDLRHEYFLLTPPGVESCLEAAGKSCSAGTKHAVYCSYHSYIALSNGTLVYANTPYMDGTNCDTGEEHPNGDASDATLGGGLVHEHSESVTDPELNAWYDSKGNEVADKCRTLKVSTEFGEPLGQAPDGADYNQVIDGDLYWYQQEWSNEAGGCVQRVAQRPAITKMSPKSGPASGGTVVTIAGSGFTSPAVVDFGEVPASEVQVLSSSTISAVAPPGAGGAVVYVTVTTAVGASPVSAKARFKYKKVKK